MENENFYTLGEEIANAITHGIGALLSIAALVILIVHSSIYGTAWHVVSYTIFGTTLIILYTGSTLYHSITNKKAKHVFRIFDHSSIYLLIAGTYTPYTLTVLRSPLGWTIFGVIWGLTVLGIVIKSLWVGKYDKISTAMYVIMGWMVAISLKKLWLGVPHISFWLLLIGGILYTLGAVLYSFDKIPYNHPIWHLFVMAGSTCHFFSVLKMI
ncbi:hemolysin III family protein [Clostridium sp. 19966]|uniref:PAQR family membrane homeostasis protein TrhA n=1 Tax=Clostridium sp. 19966 TaxID=2768166 RepID=UPI0028DF7B6C|nr:hemolysin III family protein [Clostridium sp. 19966]MDT8716295.1 hemolysin III family protein [Clostridium sp. 19966]